MRYMFFAYTNETSWANLSVPEREVSVQKFGAFIKEVEQRGVKEVNARLQPSTTATTVHGHDGKLVVDNAPYAETKEQIAAVYILNCKDMDEAIEFAKMLPASQMGVVEIRAIADS
ncbi:MAG: YciI family protein [Chloroflexota bacterium]